MYKTFSNILITSALVILGITLVAPADSTKVANQILNSIVSKENASFIQGINPISIVRDRSSASNDDVTSSGIVDATNIERINAGLLPLQINTKLETSASVKTYDMIDRQYFEHNSPSGKGVSDLGREAGYEYVVMGENLALGVFAESSDVVAAWMQSPGHRANILNPKYQEIGVYVVKAQYQGRDAWFAVQHFGTGRNACPLIDSVLKKSIDTMNSDLKAQQIQIITEKARLETPTNPGGEEYRKDVEEFNKLVSQYNTTLVISQEKIKQYNAQVSAFNTCLAQYQK
jgi:uncharacterized protein YkwD